MESKIRRCLRIAVITVVAVFIGGRTRLDGVSRVTIDKLKTSTDNGTKVGNDTNVRNVLIGGRTHLEIISRVTIDKLETSSGNVTKELHDTNVKNVTRRYHKCKLVHPKLSKTPLPTTGLLSYPGAGNTWTRHLIQQALGI